MAAYRRMDDLRYGHLQADCLYTGISSGPNAWCLVWEAFTFYLCLCYVNPFHTVVNSFDSYKRLIGLYHHAAFIPTDTVNKTHAEKLLELLSLLVLYTQRDGERSHGGRGKLPSIVAINKRCRCCPTVYI